MARPMPEAKGRPLRLSKKETKEHGSLTEEQEGILYRMHYEKIVTKTAKNRLEKIRTRLAELEKKDFPWL